MTNAIGNYKSTRYYIYDPEKTSNQSSDIRFKIIFTDFASHCSAPNSPNLFTNSHQPHLIHLHRPEKVLLSF